jgi:hypothetical protein
VLSVLWLGAGVAIVAPKLFAHAGSGRDYVHVMGPATA